MKNTNLDMKIQEILSKRTYSNDNAVYPTDDTSQKSARQNCEISIIGNNNIIISGNLLYMTFVFLIACAWMCMAR